MSIDPLGRLEPQYDPNDPRFGKPGPATWIFSGLLAVGMIIGIFVFGSDTTNEPSTQTTENIPALPPAQPN